MTQENVWTATNEKNLIVCQESKLGHRIKGSVARKLIWNG